jgi:MFS transporter, DHA2 family, multidrug resistance protein
MSGAVSAAVASAVCAYAPSAAALIATRAVLGLGAAAIIPLSLSVLTVLFTAEERPNAVAAVMAATMVSYPLGPVLGGWLLTHYWWGSVFLINVPVVVIAVVAVATLMPESRGRRASRLDGAGIALSSLGLAGLTYGLIEAGQSGWGHPSAVAALAAGAVLTAGFLAWERRVTRAPHGSPLVDLRLFGSAKFTIGTLLATLVSFAMFGLLFAMPLYFQDVAGHDPLGSGLRLLPMIGGLLVGGTLAGRLQSSGSRPLGAKPVAAAGFAVMAAGLLLGARTSLHSGSGFAAAWFVVVGLGLGLALPAAMNAALDALTGERAGVGSALIMALRQVGATFGVAVLGTLLNSAYRGRLQLAGLPAEVAGAARDSVSAGVAVARRLGSIPLLDMVRGAFVHAMDVMLVGCAGIALAALVIAIAFLPGRRTAAPEAAAVEPPAVEAEPFVRP